MARVMLHGHLVDTGSDAWTKLRDAPKNVTLKYLKGIADDNGRLVKHYETGEPYKRTEVPICKSRQFKTD